jgi:uncharacterized membrane protein
MHDIQGQGIGARAGVASAKTRLDSIDVLRGLVILIMALDLVREYLSIVKGIDTSSMTPAYFFTRRRAAGFSGVGDAGAVLFLPKEFGFSLPVVYLLWAGLVLLMYPICRWFASVKANHRHPLLSYL